LSLWLLPVLWSFVVAELHGPFVSLGRFVFKISKAVKLVDHEIHFQKKSTRSFHLDGMTAHTFSILRQGIYHSSSFIIFFGVGNKYTCIHLLEKKKKEHQESKEH
jgi:hypothetical protein